MFALSFSLILCVATLFELLKVFCFRLRPYFKFVHFRDGELLFHKKLQISVLLRSFTHLQCYCFRPLLMLVALLRLRKRWLPPKLVLVAVGWWFAALAAIRGQLRALP